MAQELNLPVLQPGSLKNVAAQAELAALQPDVLVVAAYGLILPDAVLAAPRLAPLNVHASLLPRYRGRRPFNGPSWKTGILTRKAGFPSCGLPAAWMRVRSMRTRPCPLLSTRAGSLHDALARLGADLLIRVLDDLLDGRAVAREQDESRAGYAAKIGKEDGFIDWNRPAAQVHAHIRGVTPLARRACRLCFCGRGRAAAAAACARPGGRIRG